MACVAQQQFAVPSDREIPGVENKAIAVPSRDSDGFHLCCSIFKIWTSTGNKADVSSIVSAFDTYGDLCDFILSHFSSSDVYGQTTDNWRYTVVLNSVIRAIAEHVPHLFTMTRVWDTRQRYSNTIAYTYDGVFVPRRASVPECHVYMNTDRFNVTNNTVSHHWDAIRECFA